MNCSSDFKSFTKVFLDQQLFFLPVCQNLLWEQNIASYFVRGFQGDDYVFQSDLNFANLKCQIAQIYNILNTHGRWTLLYTSLYTWSDLIICFDSALFPQNFV